MIRRALHFLGVGTFIVLAFATGYILRPAPHQACDAICNASVSFAASWRVWNDLDCDDADYGNEPCTDEMQNVNRSPVPETIRQRGHLTDLTVQVSGKGGVAGRVALTVDDTTGQVIRDDRLTS